MRCKQKGMMRPIVHLTCFESIGYSIAGTNGYLYKQVPPHIMLLLRKQDKPSQLCLCPFLTNLHAQLYPNFSKLKLNQMWCLQGNLRHQINVLQLISIAAVCAGWPAQIIKNVFTTLFSFHVIYIILLAP